MEPQVTAARRMCVAFALALASASPAFAFEILTPASTPCHERITLGAFDLIDGPFARSDDPSLTDLLMTLTARVKEMGVPQDRITRGAIAQVSDVYDLEEFDLATRYVLISLMIGIRDPDTRGFSVVRVNVTRSTHIDDALQAGHSLRRIQDDGEPGNATAIANVRRYQSKKLRAIHAQWHSSDQTMSTVWTFPFYGEQDVRVFGPAFNLGVMVHGIQDAFTHTLRDDDARIVSVLNFAESSTGKHSEGRDGLAHSPRLDMCDIENNEFDQLRVNLAQTATINVLLAVASVLEDETYDGAPFEAELDSIYDLRLGCDLSNQYCANGWVSTARTNLTEPIDVGCQAVAGDSGHHSPLLVLLVILLAASLRRQTRRTP